jgi:hypothetical protein
LFRGSKLIPNHETRKEEYEIQDQYLIRGVKHKRGRSCGLAIYLSIFFFFSPFVVESIPNHERRKEEKGETPTSSPYRPHPRGQQRTPDPADHPDQDWRDRTGQQAGGAQQPERKPEHNAEPQDHRDHRGPTISLILVRHRHHLRMPDGR